MNLSKYEVKKCEDAINQAKKLLDDIINDENISFELKESFNIRDAEKYFENLKKVV